MTTKDVVESHYNELKNRIQFTCDLMENELDEDYMMAFHYKNNTIIYDIKWIDEVYKKGMLAGIFRYDKSRFILFCLVHELGHYYDYQENKDNFKHDTKQEYIQMEKRGIKKANKIIPFDVALDFSIFNKLIIENYERDMD